MKDKKIEITIETYEILVVSRRSSLGHVWCRVCGQQVAVISLDEACMSGASLEAVQRQAKTGRIHLIQTAGSSPLICLDSLIQI